MTQKYFVFIKISLWYQKTLKKIYADAKFVEMCSKTVQKKWLEKKGKNAKQKLSGDESFYVFRTVRNYVNYMCRG